MQLTLFCNSYNGIEPFHYQYNQKTLMCGSHFLSSELKNECLKKGFTLDDTGDNISSLNKHLGDLTGLYWIWKNSNEEFVGTNQYKRFYNEKQLDKFLPLDKDTLFVSDFVSVLPNAWQHYTFYHGDIGLKILNEAVALKKINLKKEHLDILNHASLLSPCNMFFGHIDVFNYVCNLLFEIIFELYDGCKYSLSFIQDNIHVGREGDKRLLAFLSERILNILYFYSNYYFGEIKIQPINYAIIN